MERMLVGVDESPAAHAGLGWAADLAGRAGSELVLARVYTPTQVELPPGRDEELRDEQRAELDRWAAALASGTPIGPKLLLDGDPAPALMAAAAAEDVDLVVVGRRGAGGFLHLHVGSVAHHLVHHTDRPVAVVSEGSAEPLSHLVVGVDGSDGSRAALDLCADLAPTLGIGVTAVHAYEPLDDWIAEGDPVAWASRAEEQLEELAAPIHDAGVPLDVVVDRDGHPVSTITGVLGDRPGAAAVVGTRGLGGFSGLRLGRVPLQLVHHTPAPVVVVPPT